jgi:hypothetical protein
MFSAGASFQNPEFRLDRFPTARWVMLRQSVYHLGIHGRSAGFLPGFWNRSQSRVEDW